MTETKNIFVYGTLRSPRPGKRPDDSRFYPEIAPYVVSATPARVEGAVLYDHGAYPCARPGTGTIYGEVLQVKPEAPELHRIVNPAAGFRVGEEIVATGYIIQEDVWRERIEDDAQTNTDEHG
jgi:hypothetical protein